MMPIMPIATASVIADLADTFAPYATAAFGLAAVVIAARLGLRWVKGMAARGG